MTRGEHLTRLHLTFLCNVILPSLAVKVVSLFQLIPEAEDAHKMALRALVQGAQAGQALPG